MRFINAREWKKINMFISMASHLASLWNRGLDNSEMAYYINYGFSGLYGRDGYIPDEETSFQI